MGFVLRDGNLPAYEWSGGREHGVTAWFTTRAGGVSSAHHASLNLGLNCGDDPGAVARNRRLVERAAGLATGSVRSVCQVHGARVWEADAAHARRHTGWDATVPQAEADALVGRGAGRPALAVMVADCVPVVIAGPDGMAAVHAGWRGVVAGVLDASVERLLDGDRATVAELRAAVGPAIGACCFEVGEEVARHFPAETVWPAGAQRPRVDLAGAVAARLMQLDIGCIDRLDICTSCDHRFFSHRRDAGRTGRQCALAWHTG